MKIKLSDPASLTASTLYLPCSRQDSIDTLNESCPVTCGRNVKIFVSLDIVTLDEGKLSTLKVNSNRSGAVIVVCFFVDSIIGLSEKFKAFQSKKIKITLKTFDTLSLYKHAYQHP